MEPQSQSETELSGRANASSPTGQEPAPGDARPKPASETRSATFAHAAVPRRSMEPRISESRARRSEEFDRRFDGPYGLPSRVSTGRRSLQVDGPGAPPRGESGEMVQEGGVDLPVVMPEPPPLNYTLRTRKLSIFFWWSMIVFDSVAMPIALFYGLWYGVGPGSNTPEEPSRERISANTVFSIVTAAIGGASILEYFLRMWSLWRLDSRCRILGVPQQGKEGRWYLDWFHWNFTIAWLIIMIELIVGSVQHNPYDEPYIRILSLPLATMLYVFGTELLVVDLLRYFQVPAPLRISSIPEGAQLRPGIYSLVEDICAVDGGGGTAFREALDRRYGASHVFRAMLRRLGVFWAVGAQGCAVLTTILIFTLSKDAAYTVGWSVPFVWAGVWTPPTFWYVDRELKRERKLWGVNAGRKHSV